MNSEDGKSTCAEQRDDGFESTVIDFLDEEIAASANTGSSRDAEDLNATLTNLLQEVLSEADGELQTEPKADDVDQLLSGILESARDVPNQDSPEAARMPLQPEVPAPLSAKDPVPIVLPFQGISHPSVMPAISSPVVFATHTPRPVLPRILIGMALLLLLGGVGLVFKVIGTKPPSTAAGESGGVSQSAVSVPPAIPETDKAVLPAAPELPVPSTEPAPVTKPAAAPRAAATKPEAPRDAATKPAALPGLPPSEALTASAGMTASAELNLPPKPKTAMDALPYTQTQGLAGPTGIPESPSHPVAEAARPPVVAAENAEANASSFLAVPAKREPPPAPTAPPAVLPPALISRVPPAYPEMARRMKLGGTVVLDLQIDENGRVRKAVPVSGLSMLTSAAVEAALRWRYKPASSNGKSIPSQSRVSMIFANQ
jgi:protein TonB